MITTFKKIWRLVEPCKAQCYKALAYSFVRCFMGLTQFAAIIAALSVVLGDMSVTTGLIIMVVATIVCVIGTYALSYQEQLACLSAGMNSVAHTRIGLGGFLRHLPLGFFTDSSMGAIISTLTTTLSGIEMAATMTFISVLTGLFTTVSFTLFMLIFDWRIGLIVALGVLAYGAVLGYQIAVSRAHAPALTRAQRDLGDGVLTFLQGIKVTKAFSFNESMHDVQRCVQESRDANIALTRVSMPSQTAAHLVIALFESLILVATLYAFLVFQDISLVKTIVLIVFSFMAFASLNQAGSALSMIGLVDAGLDELDAITSNKTVDVTHPAAFPSDYKIQLHHVSFSYGDHQVINDVSTTIEPHTTTAIIGPSGSGKTTLCQLIARFRDVTEGSITIGGVDVRDLDYDELMKHISMVFQQVYLFEDTILNNIRFGNPSASRQDVIDAAQAAHCHDLIMALPDGYDTVIGEGGSSLSGGEKQRISIARAILKDAPIIILDEATSALDAENEHDILAALTALTKNKMVIMIAHRIQTVKNADKIIALADGRIVQEGTHEQLMAEEGLYADFVHARSKASGWQISNKA